MTPLTPPTYSAEEWDRLITEAMVRQRRPARTANRIAQGGWAAPEVCEYDRELRRTTGSTTSMLFLSDGLYTIRTQGEDTEKGSWHYHSPHRPLWVLENLMYEFEEAVKWPHP